MDLADPPPPDCDEAMNPAREQHRNRMDRIRRDASGGAR
jgi:hypothetical protein